MTQSQYRKLLTFDVRDFRDTIANDPRMNDEAIVYIGSDSERDTTRGGVRVIDYSIALVIHFHENGVGRGCKMLGEIVREPDIEENLSRPFQRMLREADLLRLFYARVEDDFVLAGIEPQIHVDVSTNKEDGSNVAYKSVRGLITGTCFNSAGEPIEPHFKPMAPAASFGAHSMKRVLLDNLGSRQRPDNVVNFK